jgi:hypothetical protein
VSLDAILLRGSPVLIALGVAALILEGNELNISGFTGARVDGCKTPYLWCASVTTRRLKRKWSASKPTQVQYE